MLKYKACPTLPQRGLDIGLKVGILAEIGYTCPFLFSLEELATFPLFTCITMTRQYPAWYQDYTQCMDLVPDGRWSLRHADEGNTIVH